MGQLLVHSGYDERTYPRNITENFGYASLMFLIIGAIESFMESTEFTKGLDR